MYQYGLMKGTHIDKTFIKYDSINQASIGQTIARFTIDRYLDTNVPTKNFLYYSKPITDFNLAFNLAKRASNTLEIDGKIAKKV